MIERIELHDGIYCTVHTSDGARIRTTLPKVRSKAKWERVYTGRTNRIWMYRGDHKAMVEKALIEAKVVSEAMVITREWVLDYCRKQHLDRMRNRKDEPFHDGRALFDGDRYLVKWAKLKAAAHKAGWKGSTAQFAAALQKAGLVVAGNTTVALRQCRPWMIVLDDEEQAESARCVR